jgi:hypothetical protein
MKNLGKPEMKAIMREEQDGKCAISGKPLPEDVKLFDLDRHPLQGNKGGKYELGNVRAVLPQAHRDAHDNVPSGELGALRNTMREYRTWVKQRNQIANSFLAVKRQMGDMSDDTEGGYGILLEQAADYVKFFKKRAEKMVKAIEGNAIVDLILAQKGIGPIYAAEIITTLNPEIASTPSAFWAYVGYHGPSKDRYTKGEKGGGNKAFRSVMYNLGMNFIKNKNEYYEPLYRQRKAKTEVSEKLVYHKGKMANGKSTSGKEIPWCETTPGRRHLDALRWMNKQFLADLWHVWRKVLGLETKMLYAANHLGHTDIVDPKDRGWDY